jgi:hypothetical protein
MLCQLSYAALVAAPARGAAVRSPSTAPKPSVDQEPGRQGRPGPGHTRLPAREDKQGTPSRLGNAAALPGPGGYLSQRRSY